MSKGRGGGESFGGSWIKEPREKERETASGRVIGGFLFLFCSLCADSD